MPGALTLALTRPPRTPPADALINGIPSRRGTSYILQGDLMRHITRMALFAFLLFSSFVCATARAASPADVRGAAASACAAARQFSALAPASCGVKRVERRHIVADVFEYTFQLKVGAGERDVVGVHRVVRERAGGVP